MALARTSAGALLCLLLLPFGGLPARASTVLGAGPGTEIWLRGTTNVNHWQCRGETLRGGLRFDASATQLQYLLGRLQSATTAPGRSSVLSGWPDLNPSMELDVPIASLDCGNRAMERDVHKALRAGEYPDIAFKFDSVSDAKIFPGADGDPVRYRLRVHGQLRLAGSSRDVEISVVGLREGEDRFRLYGKLPVTMSEFGIQPPVALFGLIKARDQLTVAITLVLEPEPRGAVAAGTK